ncbi:hypothetical protein [Streptomyces sp. PT12]|uniref:hypothetical protein n=1 Tax=Streptomyces sp. PT12 TaxID=1510197 RepID=UPI0015EF419C|nr:hypothetical protein [Streptomyces sp. PT12]
MNTQDPVPPPDSGTGEGELPPPPTSSEELAARWAELNKQIDAHLEELRRK